MILLVDNYDSFTYNLYQQLETLKQKTLVTSNDKITIKDITKLRPQKIIISPGPGRPQESGISPQIIKTFHQQIPILGVCLGHELIGELFGAKVIQAPQILHGKTSQITHSQKNLFKNLPKKIQVARYHSLILDRVPENFTLEAQTKDHEIMAITHKQYPLHGIQFHPESFMTSCGNQIIQNFLNQ